MIGKRNFVFIQAREIYRNLKRRRVPFRRRCRSLLRPRRRRLVTHLRPPCRNEAAGTPIARRRAGMTSASPRAPAGRPMKIVHLLGWYFPDSVGGTEVYVEGLCRRLQDAGHEVLIAAPDPRRTAPKQYEYHGVPVFRYPITDQPTRDQAYHRVAMPGVRHLFQWLANERPDILHVHSIKTGVGSAGVPRGAPPGHSDHRHLPSAEPRLSVPHRRTDGRGHSIPATAWCGRANARRAA